MNKTITLDGKMNFQFYLSFMAISLFVLISTSVFASTVTVQWDANDASVNIKNAIAAAGVGGKVIVPYTGSIWYVTPETSGTQNVAISLDVQGIEFVLEEGVIIKAKHGGNHFLNVQSKLIQISADGVTIRGEGNGATLEMRREDYQVSPYVISQFRHAIKIKSVQNITIKNITIKKSGGDGIACGKPKIDAGVPENILVEDVHVIDPTRLGMSITSGDGVTVRNSIFEGAEGENPEAGIDIEPNHHDPDQKLKNILIEGVTVKNNAGNGFQLGLFNFFDELGKTVEDVSITIRNSHSLNNGTHGFHTSGVKPQEAGNGVGGTVKFQNVIFEGSEEHGIRVSGYKVGDAPTISFEGITIKDCATKGVNFSPIYFKGQMADKKLGGITFKSYNNQPCKLIDKNYNRPNVNAESGAKTANKGFKDITGTIHVDSNSSTFLDLGDPSIWENVTVNRVNFDSGSGGCSVLPDTTVLTASVTSCNTVSLSWDVATCADDYVVRRWTDPAVKVTLATVTGTSFVDNTAVENTAYTYLVRASNSIGQTNSNTPVVSTGSCSSGGGYEGTYYHLKNVVTGQHVKVPNCSPDFSGTQVINTAPNTNVSDCATFYFQDAGLGYYYMINESTSGRFKPENNSTLADANIVQVGSGTTSTLVQWEIVDAGSGEVRIKNRSTGMYLKPDGCDTTSGTIITQVSDISGNCTKWELVDAGSSSRRANSSKALVAQDQIRIYPNPTTNILNVKLGDRNVSQMAIMDVTGKTIALFGTQQQIDVSSLQRGLYTLRVSDQEGESIIRFIKH
ncbi:right-handed parallel beta-helix repeat-containing protein [Reichenbachiella carrageenanivorans]|uniref:Right-handed parallel beta-helix repeat-containing protein n=1 Tax=Reichenbachiella carrageenanivorans TaxID=2979869 RepID=A0ABY6D4C1_9BACT|nr:RICIN domain-containing protein [Reichenbachiella carrageenanivorans]UXX80991.1 right-handed parallel beta-helix repeat-containing protein [Reichenbachiella carrageenanivorans]